MVVKHLMFVVHDESILLSTSDTVLSTKKTNPTEFLLGRYKYQIAGTPQNYFDHVRIELFFQKLLFWFFHRYGLFFFISQFKMRDYYFLVQFYYYKTYMVPSFNGRVRLSNRISTKTGVLKTLKKSLVGGAVSFGGFFWPLLRRYRVGLQKGGRIKSKIIIRALPKQTVCSTVANQRVKRLAGSVTIKSALSTRFSKRSLKRKAGFRFLLSTGA